MSVRGSSAADGFEIELLYDGACPLCSREVAMLRSLDRGRGRLRLTDIAAPGFDAPRYGRNHEELMARIHGALPDGRLVEGMEAFRRAYTAVGLGWLLAPTRWPGLRRLADAAYRWFARNRLRWTGRARACACEALREVRVTKTADRQVGERPSADPAGGTASARSR